MTTTANTFDAIVVGSGISGGWAAKELAQRGLKTLVLERGRNLRHIVDYTTALQDPWQLPHHNRPTQQDRADQPIQSNLYLYDQSTKQHFVNDIAHPYRQAQPFNWYRGYQVGGRSLMWARHVFRYSDLDFEANLREGVGIDWPIRYADLAPWYEHVERFIGASGENSDLPQLPAQVLQPPFEMNAFEKHIRTRMAGKFTDRKLICSATAVLSRPHNGRGPCQCLLFLQQRHAARRRGHRESDIAAGRDRALTDLRRRQESRHGCTRDRWQYQAVHRIFLASRVLVRLDAELDRDSAQLTLVAIPERSWQ
jgi:choline dehydrogenase-like flavoprotein